MVTYTTYLWKIHDKLHDNRYCLRVSKHRLAPIVHADVVQQTKSNTPERSPLQQVNEFRDEAVLNHLVAQSRIKTKVE